MTLPWSSRSPRRNVVSASASSWQTFSFAGGNKQQRAMRPLLVARSGVVVGSYDRMKDRARPTAAQRTATTKVSWCLPEERTRSFAQALHELNLTAAASRPRVYQDAARPTQTSSGCTCLHQGRGSRSHQLRRSIWERKPR